MKITILLSAAVLCLGLLKTSHATSCLAATGSTCAKTLFMTGSCKANVCQCASGYSPGPYGCQKPGKAELGFVAFDGEAKEGETFTLLCAGGSPYKWFKDGAEISSEITETLTKVSTTKDDSGSYTCEGTAAGLTTEKSDAVEVTVTDALTIKPVLNGMPTKAVEGMEIQLTCDGGPATAISQYGWKVDGIDKNTDQSTYKYTVVDADKGKDITCTRGGVESEPKKLPATLEADITGAIVSSSNLNPIEDETLSLSCDLTDGFQSGSTTKMVYAWKKGATSLTSTDPTYAKNNIAETDAGAYTCSINFDGKGEKTSPAVTVTVSKSTAVKDKIVSSSPDAPLTGGYFSLTCNFKSTSKSLSVQYSWKKGNADLLGVNDKVLQFNEAKPSDAASYTCTVTSDGGFATNDAFIVKPPVAITTITPSVGISGTVGVGNTITITCDHSGQETPGITYEWSIDNDIQAGEVSSTIKHTPTKAGTLTISCTAKFDGASSLKASKQIDPKYIVGMKITAGGQEVTTLKPVVSTKVKVKCDVTKSADAGAVTYDWTKDGGASLGTSSELEITAPSAGTTETYECKATIGAEEEAASVTVEGTDTAEKPEIRDSEGTALAASKDVKAEGNLAMYCVSGSYAEGATFEWSRGGDVVSGATSMIYTINDISSKDAGAYTCKITVGGKTSVDSNAVDLTVSPNEVKCTYTQDCVGLANFDETACYSGKCKCLRGFIMKGGECKSGSRMLMASLLMLVFALLVPKLF